MAAHLFVDVLPVVAITGALALVAHAGRRRARARSGPPSRETGDTPRDGTSAGRLGNAALGFAFVLIVIRVDMSGAGNEFPAAFSPEEREMRAAAIETLTQRCAGSEAPRGSEDLRAERRAARQLIELHRRDPDAALAPDGGDIVDPEVEVTTMTETLQRAVGITEDTRCDRIARQLQRQLRGLGRLRMTWDASVAENATLTSRNPRALTIPARSFACARRRPRACAVRSGHRTSNENRCHDRPGLC